MVVSCLRNWAVFALPRHHCKRLRERNGVGKVGVADGVGGWAPEGLDSGEYSRAASSRNALSSIQAVVSVEQFGSRAGEVRIGYSFCRTAEVNVFFIGGAIAHVSAV